MSTAQLDLADFHWLMDILQNIDAGLVVLDRDYQVQLWNGFMEHHSGISSMEISGDVLFDRFPELSPDWFKRKAEAVFQLRSRVFTTWEQRPYLLKFSHGLPLTGHAEYMYQNSTLLPLAAVDGSVSHICLIIYDVTDMATGSIELEQANQKLEHLSRSDRLTGLNNRGYWEECLAREFKRSQRTGHPVSLIMFDIDHFKRINDTYGHPTGDEVLRRLADWIRAELRQTDIVGRYGGEEFALLLVDTPADGARIMAERLRSKVASTPVQYEGHQLQFTISLGIAEFSADMENYSAWLSTADKALYQSKEGGRNRLTVAGKA